MIKKIISRKRNLVMAVAIGIGAMTIGAFAIGSQSSKVNAEALICTGENLLTALETTDPDIVKTIADKAAALTHGDGILWQITNGDTQPSYVFGTMHISDPRLIDLGPKTQKAFDASHTLALEITDVVDPQKMKEKAASLAQYTLYSDGLDITAHLTDQQEKEISEALSERLPLPWFVAKRLKPWALMGALSVPACEQARKEAGQPFLDQSLALEATAAGKKLVSLETMESQMKAMSSLPDATMIKALHDTTRMGKRIDDVFETMIQLYEQEKIALVWAMMKHMTADGLQPTEDQSDYAAFQREIVDKRNVSMVENSIPLIEKGGAFIAVGALHLPGEMGILNILAQKGYTIRRM